MLIIFAMNDILIHFLYDILNAKVKESHLLLLTPKQPFHSTFLMHKVKHLRKTGLTKYNL